MKKSREESPRVPVPEGEAEGLDRVVHRLVDGDEPASALDECPQPGGAFLAQAARVLLRHAARFVPARDPPRALRGEKDDVEAGQVAAPHVGVPHVLPLEAVPVQHPAGPAFRHRGLPRAVDRDARGACRGGRVGGQGIGRGGEREPVLGRERPRRVARQPREPVRAGGNVAVRRRQVARGPEALPGLPGFPRPRSARGRPSSSSRAARSPPRPRRAPRPTSADTSPHSPGGISNGSSTFTASRPIWKRSS